MKRFAQIIRLKADKKQEYITLHKNTPKEVLAMIKQCHIQNYSIYNYGEFLFAYFEYTGKDYEKDMAKMAQDEATKQWWKLTDACQISLDEKRGKWLNIQEVFHLD